MKETPYFKKLIRILIIYLYLFFLISCSKHIAPVPNVELKKSEIVSHKSEEYKKAKRLSAYLVKNNIKPIYLFIEDRHLKNESGTGAGALPNYFKQLAMFAAFDFQPKIEVYTSINKFAKLLQDPKTKDRAFEIDGIISAYNTNKNSISSSIDFGFDFGNGEGEGSADQRGRNRDTVSSLTLDMMFHQNGKMYAARSNTLNINKNARSYSFGLSINDAGFGINASNNKSEDVGEIMKRLLHHMLYELILEVLERKSLLSDSPLIKTESESDIRKASTSKLNEDEKTFLNRIRGRKIE